MSGNNVLPFKRPQRKIGNDAVIALHHGMPAHPATPESDADPCNPYAGKDHEAIIKERGV